MAPPREKLALYAAAGIGAFALLLLIISVGTTTWLDDGSGNTVGLFRKCYGDGVAVPIGDGNPPSGCIGENRVTQGGLSVFGLLLLVFGIVALIAGAIRDIRPALLASIGLFYFASMFVMAAYATWGTYSRDPYSYGFPSAPINFAFHHTSLGASYNLCVAAHYFLWTALTLLAFGVGYVFGTGPATAST